VEFDRFLEAQAPVYDQATLELMQGRKISCWMWFIFPQMSGLGKSATSQLYAIESLDQARRYLAHPVLGPRLRVCTKLALLVRYRSAEGIFGKLDALKFWSSMTLFSLCALQGSDFHKAIDRFYDGVRDPNTLDLIASGPQTSARREDEEA
jgi:uncharacterized protein (DUF1810 family)